MSASIRLAKALARADQPGAEAVFLHRNETQAQDLARTLDQRTQKGLPHGAFHGVPVVIKGNIDLQGLPTTAGSLAIDARPACANAPLILRLIDAGAIPLGHANMSEFAFSGLGVNPHYGTSINGLDAALVPGGSSSGCATAITLGIVDHAIGTDTSGSTRVPAAYQGIVGFRPSMGRYDPRNIVPLAPSLDTPGPMARNMAGLRALDDVLRLDKGPSDTAQLHQLIVPTPEDLVPLDPDIAQMFQQVIDLLKASGWQVNQKPVPRLRQVQNLFQRHGTLVAAEAPATLSRHVPLDHPNLDVNIRRRLSQSMTLSGRGKEVLHDTRSHLQALLRDDLKDGLLIMPTVPAPPPRLDQVLSDLGTFASENARALSLTMLGAFLDMPSLALPVGVNKPGHSLTIAGPSGADARVLELGSKLEPVLAEL